MEHSRMGFCPLSLLICAALSMALFTNSGASAESLDLNKAEIKLLDFSIDATEKPLGEVITCSQGEVEKGVFHPFSLIRQWDYSFRFLNPGYSPLSEKRIASWLFANNKCAALDSLNGIGFRSYDPQSGAAMIYLATFQEVTWNREVWDNSDEYDRFRLFFYPQFKLTKEYRFSAQCNLVPVSWLDKVKGVQPSELVCRLTQSRGFIRFAVRNLGS